VRLRRLLGLSLELGLRWGLGSPPSRRVQKGIGWVRLAAVLGRGGAKARGRCRGETDGGRAGGQVPEPMDPAQWSTPQKTQYEGRGGADASEGRQVGGGSRGEATDSECDKAIEMESPQQAQGGQAGARQYTGTRQPVLLSGAALGFHERSDSMLGPQPLPSSPILPAGDENPRRRCLLRSEEFRSEESRGEGYRGFEYSTPGQPAGEAVDPRREFLSSFEDWNQPEGDKGRRGHAGQPRELCSRGPGDSRGWDSRRQ